MVENVNAVLMFDERSLVVRALFRLPPQTDLVYLVRNGCQAPPIPGSERAEVIMPVHRPQSADEIIREFASRCGGEVVPTALSSWGGHYGGVKVPASQREKTQGIFLDYFRAQ